MIKIQNPLLTDQPKTFLSSAIVAGATTLPVLDSNAFVAGDFVVLGVVGEQQTEKTDISSVASTSSMLVTATGFGHSEDTVVYKTLYDQIRIYRSTTGSTGTYSLLSTVSIEWQDMYTTYTDPNEDEDYYYKVTFLNSSSGVETAQSDAITPAGISAFSLTQIQNEILSLFTDEDQRLTNRSEITEWINQASDKMFNYLIQTDESFGLTVSSNVAVTGAQFYALPTDMLILKRVETSASDDSANWFKLFPVRIDNVQYGLGSGNTVASTPYQNSQYYLKGSSIGFTPNLTSGYYRVWYYPTPTRLTNSTDTLDVALRPYKHLVVAWVMYRLKQKERKFNEAKIFLDEFTGYFAEMKENVDLRQYDENYRITNKGDYSLTDGF